MNSPWVGPGGQRFRVNWRNGPRPDSPAQPSWLYVELRALSSTTACSHPTPTRPRPWDLGWTSTPLSLDLYTLATEVLAQGQADQFEGPASLALTFHPSPSEVGQERLNDWLNRARGVTYGLILPLIPDQNWTSEGPRPLLIQWDSPGRWTGRIQITGSPRACVRHWRHILTTKRSRTHGNLNAAPPTPAMSPPRDDDDQRQVRSIIDPSGPVRPEQSVSVEALNQAIVMMQRVFKMFHRLVQQPPFASNVLIAFLVSRKARWVELLHQWSNRRLRPPDVGLERVLSVFNSLEQALARIAWPRDLSWMSDSHFSTFTAKAVQEVEAMCQYLMNWTYVVQPNPAVSSVPLDQTAHPMEVSTTLVDLQPSLRNVPTGPLSHEISTRYPFLQRQLNASSPCLPLVPVDSHAVVETPATTQSSSTSRASLPCQETTASSTSNTPALPALPALIYTNASVALDQSQSSNVTPVEPPESPHDAPLSSSELIAKVKAIGRAAILSALSQPPPVTDAASPTQPPVNDPGSPTEVRVWRENHDPPHPTSAHHSSCYLDSSSLKSLMLGLLEEASSCRGDFNSLIDHYLSGQIVTHVFIQKFILLVKKNIPDPNILDVESRLLSCSDLRSLVGSICKSANPSLDIPLIGVDSPSTSGSSDEIEILEVNPSSTKPGNPKPVRFLAPGTADPSKTEEASECEMVEPFQGATHKISGFYCFQRKQPNVFWILMHLIEDFSSSFLLMTQKFVSGIEVGDFLEVTLDEVRKVYKVKLFPVQEAGVQSLEIKCPLIKGLMRYRSCVKNSSSIYLKAETFGSFWTQNEHIEPLGAGMTTNEWTQIQGQSAFAHLIRHHFWGVFQSTQQLLKTWILKFQDKTNYIVLKTNLMALFVPHHDLVQIRMSPSKLTIGEHLTSFVLPGNLIRIQIGSLTHVFSLHTDNLKAAMSDLQSNRMVALPLHHFQRNTLKNLMHSFEVPRELRPKTTCVLKGVKGLAEAWIGGSPREDPKEYLIVFLKPYSVEPDGANTQLNFQPNESEILGSKFDALFFPKMMSSQEHYQTVCRNIWPAKYVKLHGIDKSCWMLNIGEDSLFSRPLRIRSFDIEDTRVRTVILSSFREEILQGNQPLLSTFACLETVCVKKRLSINAWRWIISNSSDLDFIDLKGKKAFTPNDHLQLSLSQSLPPPTSSLSSSLPIEPTVPSQSSSSEPSHPSTVVPVVPSNPNEFVDEGFDERNQDIDSFALEVGELVQEPAQPRPLTSPDLLPSSTISLGPITSDLVASQLEQDIEFNSEEEPDALEARPADPSYEEVDDRPPSPVLEMENLVTDAIRGLAENPDPEARSVSCWTKSIQIVLNKNHHLTAQILSQTRVANDSMDDTDLPNTLERTILPLPEPNSPQSQSNRKRKCSSQPDSVSKEKQARTQRSKEAVCQECRPAKIFSNQSEVDTHQEATGHTQFEFVLVDKVSLDALLSRKPRLAISKVTCDND